MEVMEFVSPARAAPPAVNGKTTKNEVKDEGVQFKDSLKEKINKESAPTEKKKTGQNLQSAKQEDVSASAALAALVAVSEMQKVIPVDAGLVEEAGVVSEVSEMPIQTMTTTETENADPSEPTGTTAVEKTMAETTAMVVDQPAMPVTNEVDPTPAVITNSVATNNESKETPEMGTAVNHTDTVVKKDIPQTEVQHTTLAEQENGIPQGNQVAAPVEVVMKTTDTGQTVQPLPEKVVTQVVHTVREMVENGQKVINLSLHPDDLGKVNIRISNGPEGLRVIVAADRSATGELLEKSISQLQEKLSSAGVQIGEMSVGYYQQDAQNSQQEWKPENVTAGFQINMPEENPKPKTQWVSSRKISETALDYMA